MLGLTWLFMWMLGFELRSSCVSHECSFSWSSLLVNKIQIKQADVKIVGFEMEYGLVEFGLKILTQLTVLLLLPAGIYPHTGDHRFFFW